MLRRDLDIVVVPAPAGFLVFDAQIGEVHLVIEVRQVVLARPFADLVVGPIGVSVVIGTVAIALVEPLLVLTLELVVENDPFDARITLRQPLRRAFVRAIDLEVVFQLPLPFNATPERLAVTVVAVTMVFEQAPAVFRQRRGILARAGHPNHLDQPLLAEVP